MGKVSHIPFLGSINGVEFYVFDTEKSLLVGAKKNGEIAEFIKIGSKSYFYGLLGKMVFDLYIRFQEKLNKLIPTLSVDPAETEGEWEKQIFLGENGLVMLFSQEQFVLHVTKEVQNIFAAFLQGKYDGLKYVPKN